MLLRIKKFKYWLDIWDSSMDDIKESDGYWIAFLRKNIRISGKERVNFQNQVWNFLEITGIHHARISLPYNDRLIVFTSCNKSKISQVKQLIQHHLKIKHRHLIWKASYESEYSWERGNWLDLMDSAFSAYETQLEINNIHVNKATIEIKSRVYQTVLEEMLMKRDSMVIRPVFSPIEYIVDKNSAFVLMPFGESWSDDVYYLIKRVGNKISFSIKRADDFFEPNEFAFL